MTHNRVLIIDDDEIAVGLLRHLLEERSYQVEQAEDGEAGWRCLQRSASYDALLVDWEMPRLNGIDLLRRLKETPELASIPAIMVTGRNDPDCVRAGLAAGAYFYLVKPFQHNLLLAVVDAGVQMGRALRQSAEDRRELDASLALLTEARFAFRSMEEAHRLSHYVSRLYPNPARTLTGLLELTANAVEHGNLALSYAEKKSLLLADRWHETLVERLRDPVLGQRSACLHLQRTAETIRLMIADEGGGFDWRGYLDFDAERAYDPNGRGIAVARMMSFNAIEYQGKGNTAVATVKLTRPESSSP